MKNVRIIFNDLAVSKLKHVHVSVGTNGSEEGCRSSGAEVTSSCGLPEMDAGNERRTSVKAVCALELNHLSSPQKGCDLLSLIIFKLFPLCSLNMSGKHSLCEV